ncbi:DUF1217 domain-containing protein [Thioclava atlantica]|uniref:Flagellar protein n=1 Tax=Thioclava atlantica TaxID=1317124 RepID=A0A085TTN0_9RHOB|nr:DUF1217 domain-containing protein [Thioclava atlantica]KFE34077.1 flagellar protein [Thioclava atlantica]
MSYRPVLTSSGSAGWAFLNRTLSRQQAAFNSSAEIRRESEYFRDRIDTIRTPEALVGNRRLLSVALGAFGLREDIDNRFFIRKVLEEGSLDPGAIANKLSDKRYLALTRAFGFGDFDTPRTALSDFADEILALYERREFETAVGEADNDMRIALALQRDLPELARQQSSEATKWYTIIASPVMSRAFQAALSLPDSVASLDVDQQYRIYSEKAERVYGSPDPAQFADPARLEAFTRDFLQRAQLRSSATMSAGASALQLLQTAARGGLSLRL